MSTILDALRKLQRDRESQEASPDLHSAVTAGPLPTLKPRKKGEYLPDRLADESIAFVTKNRAKPFFLCLWPYAVHWPMDAPAERVGSQLLVTSAGQTSQASPESSPSVSS